MSNGDDLFDTGGGSDLGADTWISEQIGTDFLTSVENALGGNGPDVITGSFADNILRGNLGDDTIYDGSGGDGLDICVFREIEETF